jgi:hypothetical protein
VHQGSPNLRAMLTNINEPLIWDNFHLLLLCNKLNINIFMQINVSILPLMVLLLKIEWHGTVFLSFSRKSFKRGSF